MLCWDCSVVLQGIILPSLENSIQSLKCEMQTHELDPRISVHLTADPQFLSSSAKAAFGLAFYFATCPEGHISMLHTLLQYLLLAWQDWVLLALV